ncbi:MAG: hypothetical protein ABR502_08100 [Chitinophagaceae bacterium]
MEERAIHIIDWPKEQKAQLDHSFSSEVPMHVTAWPKEMLNVNMNMLHNQGRDVPLCIKICEPICAESNYKVSLSLLGQPFIEIAVRGITRLFACNDRPNDPNTPNAPDNPGIRPPG